MGLVENRVFLPGRGGGDVCSKGRERGGGGGVRGIHPHTALVHCPGVVRV